MTIIIQKAAMLPNRIKKLLYLSYFILFILFNFVIFIMPIDKKNQQIEQIVQQLHIENKQLTHHYHLKSDQLIKLNQITTKSFSELEIEIKDALNKADINLNNEQLDPTSSKLKKLNMQFLATYDQFKLVIELLKENAQIQIQKLKITPHQQSANLLAIELIWNIYEA